MKLPKQLQAHAALALTLGLIMPPHAAADIYINELMFNAGGGGSDATDLYVELRGTASMSLADHYLIFLENEDTPTFDGQTDLFASVQNDLYAARGL